ncbi:MAG: hypothetical protein JWO82_39 [Akkermansiaceae bacterium]|nr:hypothetical protein [Akkermansiaceae bacterium]
MTPSAPADASVRPVTGRGWNNPIFRRYCRSRLRPKKLAVSLLLVVMIAGFIFAMSGAVGRYRIELSEEDAARLPIIPLLVFQGIILFFLGTAQAAGGMVAERDEGVIDYQRLIPMRPLSKVLGYLFGLPVAEYVMVLVTLPFTAWSLWKGDVAMATWLPLYGIFFSTGLLYHSTGLVTGTVVKNRRWAFLVSIGLVFGLYTVIPQMARFGLVFFKYLTIMPVYEELLSGIVPKTAGAMVDVGQRLAPTVKFFGLNFSETVFTLFSQGGLVLTFLVMLCRTWRRSESHLMGKAWAVGFFIWIQVLLLGNALPLVDGGELFPSRGFNRYLAPIQMLEAARRRGGGRPALREDWVPQPGEAVLMAGAYGLVTLLLLFVLARMITPSPEQQMRGWRRARKNGARALPFFSDAASSSWFVTAMALTGAAGWYVFTRALVESQWFPGQVVPLSVLAYFTAILLAIGLGFQVLLEWRGGRTLGLTTILAGIAPMMVGAVMGMVSNTLLATATWVVAISPVSLPVYAVGSLLSLSTLPPEISLAVPRAFQFWLLVYGLMTLWLLIQSRKARRAMAGRILTEG